MQDNTILMGLFMSSGVYCTQCEAEGFRGITYFYDRPDCLAKQDLNASPQLTDCLCYKYNTLTLYKSSMAKSVLIGQAGHCSCEGA